MAAKIGVYICHCGTNIAGKVNSEEVAEFAKGLRDVVVARDYKFMCSDPGQEMIQKDIHEQGLNDFQGNMPTPQIWLFGLWSKDSANVGQKIHLFRREMRLNHACYLLYLYI